MIPRAIIIYNIYNIKHLNAIYLSIYHISKKMAWPLLLKTTKYTGRRSEINKFKRLETKRGWNKRFKIGLMTIHILRKKHWPWS
jgi:hypothetical protein